MPGSKKAVDECFGAIKGVLPHAIELIRDEKSKTEKTHKEIQTCKVVNKVAPTLIDKKEMIKMEQENVPVEPSTHNSNPNMSIPIEKLEISRDFESTTMSEIIINDTQDILNINLATSTPPTSEKRRSLTDIDDLELKPPSPKHVCPHKTARVGDATDRNSIYPMVEVENALEIIYSKIKNRN